MGAGESRACTSDQGEFDFTCGLGRGGSDGKFLSSDPDGAEMTAARQVVERWIAAREAGDVETAAACCHSEFAFSSAQLSLQGLESAKERLFVQKAPMPTETTVPMTLKTEYASKDRPCFYREVKFVLGAADRKQELNIHQEWFLICDSETNNVPLIVSVSASRA